MSYDLLQWAASHRPLQSRSHSSILHTASWILINTRSWRFDGGFWCICYWRFWSENISLKYCYCIDLNVVLSTLGEVRLPELSLLYCHHVLQCWILPRNTPSILKFTIRFARIFITDLQYITSYILWAEMFLINISFKVFKCFFCLSSKFTENTRWFKYDRDKLWLVYTHRPGHIWTTL